jgi:acetoin utilization protein AcuB
MWMTRDPVTVAPETTIVEAARLMSRRHIRRLPVVVPDEGGGERLVGIVSYLEVLRSLPRDVNPFAWEMLADAEEQPDYGSVAAIMTREVTTVAPQTPIEEAARILRDQKIGALPVLLGARLTGIITESDIFRAFVGVLRVDDGGVRVTFDITHEDHPLAVALAVAQRHQMRVTSFLTAREDELQIGVVRVQGPHAEELIDDLWASGHKVLSVLHASPTLGRR